MLNFPTDPDMLEALISARTCEDDERDFVFEDMMKALIHRDASMVRLLISQIVPRQRALAWLRLCLVTMQDVDIDAGIRSVDEYVPRESTEEDVFLPASARDLRTGFRVLHACVRSDWVTARSLADDLESKVSHLSALANIARASGLPEDAAAVARTLADIEREMGYDGTNINIVIAAFQEIADFKRYESPSGKLDHRLQNLRRMVEINAPDILLVNFVRMAIEEGGLDEGLKIASERGLELEDMDGALAIGYARKGDVAKARVYAERTTGPRDRSLAYTWLYIAKLGERAG